MHTFVLLCDILDGLTLLQLWEGNLAEAASAQQDYSCLRLLSAVMSVALHLTSIPCHCSTQGTIPLLSDTNVTVTTVVIFAVQWIEGMLVWLQLSHFGTAALESIVPDRYTLCWWAYMPTV